MTTRIVVALDWTPNTNHAGFFIAASDGLYAAAGLDVVLKSPDADPAEKLTPARQVAAGKAQFAVAPSESAVSFSTTDHEVPKLTAVAALLQGNASAICTLKSSGIDRPAKLAGKRYASYDGRFEDPIVAKIVSNDGGDGAAVLFHSLEMHAYAEGETMGAGSVVASYLAKDSSDSTWIFPSWEGVLAERAGQELNYFALEDYGIPYGYAPVLLTHPDMLSGDLATATKAFLQATAEGYKRAAADPAAAAAALCSTGHASLADRAFVEASAAAIAGKFLTSSGSWGTMELERWTAFVDFLASSGILTDREKKPIPRERLDEKTLFTNDFL
eukprot:CAMPEP_0203867624 /NCGR_PEP_ID=MMETSP0359-20131031/16633_1 /ASSEMBLY_ACC=CAM_ASM_000338 /TAXON_ID=268821 /ORGANISM="Scrippsiella Hangoei, Strain SHTV-5" /LENGTH=329 /DNA_ID=CAMNT_0050785903 /DNA_START=60 /DNA_END=1049 /DNA_ORIENTATION=+